MHLLVIPAGLYIYGLNSAFKNTLQSASSMTAGEDKHVRGSDSNCGSSLVPWSAVLLITAVFKLERVQKLD